MCYWHKRKNKNLMVYRLETVYKYWILKTSTFILDYLKKSLLFYLSFNVFMWIGNTKKINHKETIRQFYLHNLISFNYS